MSEFLSLADLATLDTDDIAAIQSRSYAAGIYTIEGKTASIAEVPPKEEGQAPMFRVSHGGEILAFAPVDKKLDPEDAVGKTLRMTDTLWPKEMSESIGLLKGKYVKAGLVPTGMPVGGVEGQEPGWVDLFVGHVLQIKVTTYKDATGDTRNRFAWASVPSGTDDVDA